MTFLSSTFPVKSKKALLNFQMLLEKSFQIRIHPYSPQLHPVLHLSSVTREEHPPKRASWQNDLSMSRHLQWDFPPRKSVLPHLIQSFTHYLAGTGAPEIFIEMNTCTWNREKKTSGCFPQQYAKRTARPLYQTQESTGGKGEAFSNSLQLIRMLILTPVPSSGHTKGGSWALMVTFQNYGIGKDLT